MQQHLYPTDWKARAAACLARAGYRCEDCGTPQGVLRVGKRSKSPYVLVEMRSAGMRITQEGERFYWQVGDLSGLANDLLDAIGSALHCLRMERLEVRA